MPDIVPPAHDVLPAPGNPIQEKVPEEGEKVPEGEKASNNGQAVSNLPENVSTSAPAEGEADGAPAMKRRKKAEKSPEQLLLEQKAKERQKEEKAAAKERIKAEKAAEKEEIKKAMAAEKEQAKLAKQQEKFAKKAAEEEEKQQKAVLKAYEKELGDNLKNSVQSRSTSMQYRMDSEQFAYVFGVYAKNVCSKTITTLHRYSDGREKTTVEQVEAKLYLNEGQVQSVFGIGKTKGGSYGRFYGATTWNIVSMVVIPPINGIITLSWKLSDGADWSR